MLLWLTMTSAKAMVSDTSGVERPLNVLFVACDDLRADLGAYGHPGVKTPNLDKLAKYSLVFSRAYTQQALCAPSRLSLMTGRRPDSLKSWNLTSPIRRTSDIVTLPEAFRDAGYFTQNIGKIYHNWHVDGHVDYPRSWSVPPVMHYGTHGADTPHVAGQLPEDFATTRWTSSIDVPDEAYYDGRIAAAATAALDSLGKHPEQPFFLAVGFWKPHVPFNAPKRYWDMYDRADIPAVQPATPPVGVPLVALHDSWEFFRGQPNTLTAEATQELRHGYLAAISYLDAQVGKLLDALKQSGLDQNTIIVFWSDHGFHLGEHALWGKTSNFELDARTPLMVHVPGMATGGQQTASLVELLDIYPTLLDLCGINYPVGLQGTSLVPVLANPGAIVKEAAFTQHPRPSYYKGAPEAMGYSVRTDRWRYTEWVDWQTGKVIDAELYDHHTDPDETINLAPESEHGTLIKQLSGLLNEAKK